MTAFPKLIRWSPGRSSRALDAFLERPPTDPRAERVARKALEAVRREGDTAVLRYSVRFDGARLTRRRLRVSEAERRRARRGVDASFAAAARDVLERVSRFARAGLRPDWSMSDGDGGRLGERFVPLDRVGVYVPGGAAPLASTALMTIPLARAAGVAEIAVCSPPGRDGNLDSRLLFAADLAGATEIYRVGGIQAIGAMAYGTATIRPVRKIVGPGGLYVTAAKRLVYGRVALDMVAGPSEIAVLADDSADPAHAAADLLSQAEHGTGHERALLVTTSQALAVAVRGALPHLARDLSHAPAAAEVLRKGTLLVVVPDLAAGMELCNRFAPEHLELLVRDAPRWVSRVRAAGAVFVGRYTPESAGDFAAGPSHVLPTGGTAAFFSGLTADDFRRRISVVRLTRKGLRNLLPAITAFGAVEGLEAHARSAQVRFGKSSKPGKGSSP